MVSVETLKREKEKKASSLRIYGVLILNHHTYKVRRKLICSNNDACVISEKFWGLGLQCLMNKNESHVENLSSV